MKNKVFLKPSSQTLQCEASTILASSYTDVQTTSTDSDGPNYDGNSSINTWIAN